MEGDDEGPIVGQYVSVGFCEGKLEGLTLGDDVIGGSDGGNAHIKERVICKQIKSRNCEVRK